MTGADATREARLRIACALLAPPPAKGSSVRDPLAPGVALATIRDLSDDDRAKLSGYIDWVLDYEAGGG
ncbi:MAG: hypothetical protein PVS3B2_00130 [Candidatus Dormibacteraceae bacterium]